MALFGIHQVRVRPRQHAAGAGHPHQPRRHGKAAGCAFDPEDVAGHKAKPDGGLEFDCIPGLGLARPPASESQWRHRSQTAPAHPAASATAIAPASQQHQCPGPAAQNDPRCRAGRAARLWSGQMSSPWRGAPESVPAPLPAGTGRRFPTRFAQRSALRPARGRSCPGAHPAPAPSPQPSGHPPARRSPRGYRPCRADHTAATSRVAPRPRPGHRRWIDDRARDATPAANCAPPAGAPASSGSAGSGRRCSRRN